MKKLVKNLIVVLVIALLCFSGNMSLALNSINSSDKIDNYQEEISNTENNTANKEDENTTNDSITEKKLENNTVEENNNLEEDKVVEQDKTETQEVLENNVELKSSVQTLASSKTLDEGIYVIKSAINNDYVLDVANGSKTSGANVQLYQNKTLESQRFKVESLKDGYYIITAVHSNMVLDVANAGKTAGTNVWQCYRNEMDAQQWTIKDAGDGYYYLISKCNGLYLDAANGVATNGTNIAVCYGNNSNAQKFKFEKYVEPVYEHTLEDGTYVIKSAINNNYVLDVANGSNISGANVQLYENILIDSQRFEVKHIGNGYYTITAVHSGKVLDVANGGTTAGTNVWQCTKNNSNAQQWILQEAGDGYYYVISKCNELYLDAANGVAANGTNIAVCYGNKSNAQKFKFEKYDENTPVEPILEDGTYVIKSGINNNDVLDVANGSKVSGANVALYEYAGGTNQRFNVRYLDDGYYEITAVHSGMALDVANAGKAAGTNVWQCYKNEQDAQKWLLKYVGNGYYNIISKCNGLYLDAANGVAANGTNIAVCYGNNSNAQKFTFMKYDPTVEEGIYQIESAINSNYVLDVSLGSMVSGANVQLYQKVTANRQRFNVLYMGNGYYEIVSVRSNQALDVANAGTASGTNVWQCSRNGADAQRWFLKDAGNGYYNIISKCNGLYLDVANGVAANGTNVAVCYGNGSNAQKFKLVKSDRVQDIDYYEGTYGTTGLKVANGGGSYQRYYKWGSGPNVFFATFAIHGYEDLWARDGEELIEIANNFYNELITKSDVSLANKWTIYIFPGVNMDGITNGWTNNGPGRTTVYSAAPGNKGIDLNRCWQIGSLYHRYTDDRNYNGTAGFQAYEAANLRDFLYANRATNGQTVLVDLHGWTQQLIGDSQICGYYRKQFSENNTDSVGSYGTGYLINWARTNLGANGRAAKAALIELPNYENSVNGHQSVLNHNFSNRYIASTLDMLYSM